MTLAVPVEDRERTADRLLRGSIRKSYDPMVEIDWDAPLEPGKFFTPPSLVTLYGTPMWERMTPEQRIELSRQEMVNTVSVGIWFETILMQLLLRMVYAQDWTTKHVHYAFTEVADECRHSTMFGMLIDKVGGTPYPQKPRWRAIGRALPVALYGPASWVATLIGEEIFDQLQRDTMRDDQLQPLVRDVMRIHVTEEARHLSFARHYLKRTVPTLSPIRRAQLAIFAPLILGQMAQLMLKPSRRLVARYDIPKDVIDAAYTNNPEHHRETVASLQKVRKLCADLGLVKRPYDAIWRKLGLEVPSA